MDINLVNIIVGNLPSLIAIIGCGIAWLFDRKKRQADMVRLRTENKAAEACALEKMQGVYMIFVKDVEAQILKQKNQIAELKDEIIELKAENKELKGMIEQLKK